ncbi:MAG: hypothetical protein ACK2UC_01005 [Anaerolineae bacterium]
MVESRMTAIEMTGMIDEDRRLHLGGTLPVSGPLQVRVLILYPLTDAAEEAEWLGAAARNPAFASLHDPSEDIYSLSDGEPYHDET